MRQLVFVEPGVLAWQDATDPVAGPGQAVVRPLAVSRCDLDVAMAGFGLFPGPYAVGHEIAAEVVDVGAGVTGFRPGQRVAVPFQVSCGTCPPCGERHYAACLPSQARAGAAFGFGESGGGHGGGLADLLLVPYADHLLVEAPPSISDVALATIPDNVIDGYRAVVDGLRERPGSDVLIVGGDATSISLYAIQCARALGAGRIRYADSDSQRLAAASDLGADVIDVGGQFPRRLERAPIVVAASLQLDGLNCAIRSTEAYGRITVVTIHFAPETPLPLLEMYTRGITFHTSRADSRRYLPELLDLVGAGRIDPLAVPTTTVGWDDAADRWLEPALKMVVTRS
ncbi:alcohol dehydrogenase catalytic domain-containing protein [Mycobacterium sp. NBC_00419]|uniref:zinc-dependent alcohol dehydrogenase n=1 Tax=Mycobacterium sp. NBC_00419 TaxID=2975989 RepID=UPI002E1E3018